MEIETRLATESHPDSTDHWRMTPEAIDQLAEQAEGLIVTRDFDPDQPIGRVRRSIRDEEGVRLVIELAELPSELAQQQIGPAFSILEAEHDESRETIRRIAVFGFGVFRNRR